MKKLYLISFSRSCSVENYFFAEELEFINDAHVKCKGYFTSSESIGEYKRLKNENVKPKILIIPQSSYEFIEELTVEP